MRQQGRLTFKYVLKRSLAHANSLLHCVCTWNMMDSLWCDRVRCSISNCRRPKCYENEVEMVWGAHERVEKKKLSIFGRSLFSERDIRWISLHERSLFKISAHQRNDACHLFIYFSLLQPINREWAKLSTVNRWCEWIAKLNNGKSEKEKTHTQMRLRVRSEFTITFIQCSFGIEWHFYT